MMTRPEMTTGTFWVATLERAVKTAAQVAAALIGTGAVGITELDWAQIGSVSATSAVLSVLTSLASDRIGPAPGPSMVGEAAKVDVAAEFVPIVEVEPANATQAETVTPLPTSTPAVYPLPGSITPDRIGPAMAAAQPAAAATPAEVAARSEVTP